MYITNEQWEQVAPFISNTPKGPRGQGSPVLHEPRAILSAILWVLHTGAPWKDLPKRYPPYQTCHRWFQRWRNEGVFNTVLLALAEYLRTRGKLDLRETFIDGTFAPAKKGAMPLVKPNMARATKIMAVADASGFPLALHVTNA